jgi:GNAT superfamily N-acetyltransferase
MTVAVRKATHEDAEGFVRAHEASWDASIGEIVGHRLGDLASFESRVESFRAGVEAAREDAEGWVAEERDQIVGIATRVGNELRDLYVVPSAWGTGVAQRLMEAALAGVEGEVVLWVGEENARARHFYERVGWAADGERRTSVFGKDEVRYRRVLG